MNILIIGNGFDIAHKLPTKYIHFLEFIKFINRFETYHDTVYKFKLDNENYKFSDLDDDVKKYITEIIDDGTDKFKTVSAIWKEKKSNNNEFNRINHIKEMIELSKDNFWIEWFQHRKNINPNWIDFESEISCVIQEIERYISDYPTTKNKTQELIINLIQKDKPEILDNKSQKLEKYKSKMLKDLNDLIRCFEIYLEDCVRNIDKQLLSPDIYDLKIDCLLSFNYTDTYSRLYSCKNRNIEYDYIHGKSKIDSETANNMVLGIDAYLVGEERFSNTDFVEFKKFYQRLYKKTGCLYKKWIENIDKSKDDAIHNVYIFGHSLAMTDKDILTEFIKNKKTRITIYYFNENQYSDQIINLVHLIGPDELNSMVYGTNPKIVFKRQAEMINIEDSEWEILNDMNQLWSLHNLDDVKISNLINKIKEKLNSSDTVYFHNQENLISLYNALVANCYGYYDLHDNFIKIAQQLYNSESCTIFNSRDWEVPDYTGELCCYLLTDQLIKDINTLNYNIKSKVNNSLCSDDVNELLKNLMFTDITEEKAFELFDDVFKRFKSESDDCDIIWKCIHKIQDKCPKIDWKSFIKTRIDSAKQVDKIRYHQILDDIIESEYYENEAMKQEYYENEAMQ